MICRRILRQQKQWYSVRRLSSSPAAYPRNSPSAGVTSPVNNSRNTFMAAISYSRSKHTDLNIPYDMKRCFFSTQAVVDLPEGGIVDVPLAQTGEGIAECELLKWHVQEGEEVEEFQPLCEVQSDKATIEITSRYKGKVSELLHVPGDIVKVGETLLKIIVGELPFPVQTGEDSANKNLEILEISDSDNQSSVVKNTNVNGVLSTPAVRNLAKQYGLDINDVSGSGKDGRVLREDILKCATSKGIIKEALPNGSFAEQHIPSSAAYNLDYEDKEVLLRGYQRAMVKSMTIAARIPHFHYVEEIKCDALVDLKSTFKAENSDPNIKHTFLPVLIKSLSMAMTKYPFLNSSFNEEMHKVILKGSHNIGIAMATQHGLVVPNIKKVQSLSILEITKELSRLQQLASANKLSPDDVSGGTITVSNIGAIGGKFGSPLVNSPEVAIIAIGKIQKIAQFADDGTVYPASIMNINIGADHRVLDGATVARFCNEWKLFIEKPELLMLHMR